MHAAHFDRSRHSLQSRAQGRLGRGDLFGALALAVVGAGRRPSRPPTTSSAPQDVLTIQVFDQADLGGKYTVETDGTFSFPLIGRVKAGGLTLRAVRRRAEDASWPTATSGTRRSPSRSSSTAASGCS